MTSCTYYYIIMSLAKPKTNILYTCEYIKCPGTPLRIILSIKKYKI